MLALFEQPKKNIQAKKGRVKKVKKVKVKAKRLFKLKNKAKHLDSSEEESYNSEEFKDPDYENKIRALQEDEESELDEEEAKKQALYESWLDLPKKNFKIELGFQETCKQYILERSHFLDIWRVYYGEDYINCLEAAQYGWKIDQKTQSSRDHSARQTPKTISSPLAQSQIELEEANERAKCRGCLCKRNQTGLSSSKNCLQNQPHISWEMRARLLDWMMEFAAAYSLKRNSFHVGVSILDDCFESSEILFPDQLQLFAALCLLIASKEEVGFKFTLGWIFKAQKPKTSV